MLKLFAARSDLRGKTRAKVIDESVERIEEISNAALDIEGRQRNRETFNNTSIQVRPSTLPKSPEPLIVRSNPVENKPIMRNVTRNLQVTAMLIRHYWGLNSCTPASSCS